MSAHELLAAIGPKPKSPVLRKLLFPEHLVLGQQHVGTTVDEVGFFHRFEAANTRPRSLTYSQFTQQFARSGSQPLGGTDGIRGPSTLHLVPIGLSQQADDTAQSYFLAAAVAHIQAVVYPLHVCLTWQPELSPQLSLIHI